MCDPITIFAIVAGGASIQAQRSAASKNAKIAEENARLAEEAALKNAAIQRRQGEKLKARQRVAFLSAGVTFAGTPVEVLADTARDEELNALAIIQSGQINAAAHRANASAFRNSRQGILIGGVANTAATVASINNPEIGNTV